MALMFESPVSSTFSAKMNVGVNCLDLFDQFHRFFPRKRGTAQVRRAPVNLYSRRLRHTAYIGQGDSFTQSNLRRRAAKESQHIREMKRTSRVSRIKQHTLTVNQLRSQALGQIFVGNRRCRDDDEIRADLPLRQIAQISLSSRHRRLPTNTWQRAWRGNWLTVSMCCLIRGTREGRCISRICCEALAARLKD